MLCVFYYDRKEKPGKGLQRAEKQVELMPTERGHLRLESCMRLPSSRRPVRILFRLQAQPVQRPRGRNVPTKSRQAQGTRMSRGERSRAEPRRCPSFWAWCLSDAGALFAWSRTDRLPRAAPSPEAGFGYSGQLAGLEVTRDKSHPHTRVR